MKELKEDHELQVKFNDAIQCEDFDKARKILELQCELIDPNTKTCIENQITLDVEEVMNEV